MDKIDIPSQVTSFVGRKEELRAIEELWLNPQCRLLTLFGPGGIGKTRLALEVARVHKNDFADGTYFVSLQSLTEPHSIRVAIAEAVNFTVVATDELQSALFQFFANKSMLLILDNYEHLLDDAVFISELLMAAPNLRIIVTSRERLQLLEEWVYELSGLNYSNAEAGGSSDAVALFEQNAKRLLPSFSSADEYSAILRICHLVQGMPLAIELASSWVRVLNCGEIAREIEQGLDILETTTRNTPARHRSMRTVLCQSWLLLNPNEQAILQRLSVFKGGFTREAAQAVADASHYVLASLVDKSWLRHVATNRYDIHELLRQYSEEMLQASGQHSAVLNAHMEYFAQWMDGQAKGIKFRRQFASLLEIEADFENVRMAWKRAVDQKAIDALNGMLEALNFYSDMRARFMEGEKLLQMAAHAFEAKETRDEALLFIRLKNRQVRMISLGAGTSRDHVSVLAEIVQRNLEIAEFYESPSDIAFSAMMQGIVYSIDGEYSKSDVYFFRSRDIYIELDDPFYIAELMVWIAVAYWAPTLMPMEDLLEDALIIQRDIGDENGMSWTLHHLARMYMLQQKNELSERYFAESFELQRKRNNLKGLHASLLIASTRAVRSGNFEHARSLAHEAWNMAESLNLLPFRQASMALKGMLMILLEDDVEAGRKLCEEAIGLDIPHTFTVGDSYIDATVALCTAAYLNNQQDAIVRHYRKMIEFLAIYEINDAYVKFDFMIPLALMFLSSHQRDEAYIELVAFAEILEDIPVRQYSDFIKKLPLLIRTQAEIYERLPEAVYASAFERGKQLDFEVTLDRLLSLGEEEDIPYTFSQNGTLQGASHTSVLTDREREILQLVAEGFSNKQIANHLILSVGTVKWYVSEILSKLAVQSRTQAVAQARQQGLI